MKIKNRELQENIKRLNKEIAKTEKIIRILNGEDLPTLETLNPTEPKINDIDKAQYIPFLPYDWGEKMKEEIRINNKKYFKEKEINEKIDELFENFNQRIEKLIEKYEGRMVQRYTNIFESSNPNEKDIKNIKEKTKNE